jgi:hypothetical protein
MFDRPSAIAARANRRYCNGSSMDCSTHPIHARDTRLLVCAACIILRRHRHLLRSGRRVCPPPYSRTKRALPASRKRGVRIPRLIRNCADSESSGMHTDMLMHDGRLTEWMGRSSVHMKVRATVRSWPRVCQNTKVEGFAGSPYPSRHAA